MFGLRRLSQSTRNTRYLTFEECVLRQYFRIGSLFEKFCSVASATRKGIGVAPPLPSLHLTIYGIKGLGGSCYDGDSKSDMDPEQSSERFLYFLQKDYVVFCRCSATRPVKQIPHLSSPHFAQHQAHAVYTIQ